VFAHVLPEVNGPQSLNQMPRKLFIGVLIDFFRSINESAKTFFLAHIFRSLIGKISVKLIGKSLNLHEVAIFAQKFSTDFMFPLSARGTVTGFIVLSFLSSS
jgi:uncharacterized membrane protein YczE